MQKSLLAIILLFISFNSYSQYHITTDKDSIYVEFKNRRYRDSVQAVKELTALKAAYYSNPNNQDAIYQVGVQYYRDFVKPNKEEPYKIYLLYDNTHMDKRIHDSIAFQLNEKHFKGSFFEHSADSALYYFLKIDSDSFDAKKEKAIFFAISQLECYVNLDSSAVDLSNRVTTDEYIPYWYLANLDDNWKCDYSKNYLHRIYNSMIYVPDTMSNLYRMNEEPLYLSDVSKNSEILRFTFNQSFHEDIIIRVEKHGDKVTMYWKMSSRDKLGDYKGIKEHGSKELSLKTWNSILKLLKVANFNDLPNINEGMLSGYSITLDGASWFIEYKKHDYYKAYYANNPPKQVEILCLYLMELSKIDYKLNNWEPHYIDYNMTLTENDGYVLSRDILDTIISYLNENLDTNLATKKCCCYFDFYLKYNSKGALVSVKYPPDMNFISDKWSGYKGRKCRNEIKRTLRKLDLFYLELKSPLYINMNVQYDKENHTFRIDKYH